MGSLLLAFRKTVLGLTDARLYAVCAQDISLDFCVWTVQPKCGYNVECARNKLYFSSEFLTHSINCELKSKVFYLFEHTKPSSDFRQKIHV